MHVDVATYISVCEVNTWCMSICFTSSYSNQLVYVNMSEYLRAQTIFIIFRDSWRYFLLKFLPFIYFYNLSLFFFMVFSWGWRMESWNSMATPASYISPSICVWMWNASDILAWNMLSASWEYIFIPFRYKMQILFFAGIKNDFNFFFFSTSFIFFLSPVSCSSSKSGRKKLSYFLSASQCRRY